MPSSPFRPGTARPFSPESATAGETGPHMPRRQEPRANGAVRATGDDYWAPEIDLLILRVVDRMRRAGVVMAEAQWRQLAEDLVLDAARVVLDWVEAPAVAVSAPALEARGAPQCAGEDAA